MFSLIKITALKKCGDFFICFLGYLLDSFRNQNIEIGIQR